MGSPFSATRWVLFSSFGFRLIAYGGQVMILRLLSREVFGLYSSLVDLVLMGLPFLPMGLDALLIREKNRATRYRAALSLGLFFTGMILTLLLLLGILLPAPGVNSILISSFSNDVDSAAILKTVPFMGLVLLVMATKLSMRSVLAAKLDFKKISIGEFGNGIITWIGGAVAAWMLPSAWPLMAAYLCGEFFECWWMYRGAPFQVNSILSPKRFRILTVLFRKHRKFCLANTADLTLNNMASAIPGPMILSMVSAAAAADFRVSRLLIQLPILLLAGSIWRVAYPTLSNVSEEVLHDRCLRIIGTTAAFLVPGVLWLAIYAPALAVIVGGEKYAGAAPLVQWMALYMILTAIYSPISSLDMIRDKPEIGLYWNAVHTAARAGVIWYFASSGVVTVIAAMSITSALLWIVWIAMLGALLGAGWKRYIWTVIRFAPGWLLLGVAFWTVEYMLGPVSWILMLAVSAIVGGLYGVVHLKFFPREAEMIWRLAGRGRKA